MVGAEKRLLVVRVWEWALGLTRKKHEGNLGRMEMLYILIHGGSYVLVYVLVKCMGPYTKKGETCDMKIAPQ